MSRGGVADACAFVAALFLLLIGALHGYVNVTGLRRATLRGDIPARFGNAVLVNAGFSGAALVVFGLIVLLCLPGLRRGDRETRRIAVTIGIVVALIGGLGYWWSPGQPSVLVFLLFGLLLAAPQLLARRTAG